MKGSPDTNSASFSYSDFIPVKSRKKRKGKNVHPSSSPSASLASLREQLQQDEWFLQCSHILKGAWSVISPEPPAILCLGLGSPTMSPNSNIQLAFLVEMCRDLKIEHDNVSLYDPVFTAEDTALFEDLHMRVLTENRNAQHPVDVPTMCLMPHCDMELYENFLKVNWSQERLSKALLVGNRLGEYVDSNPNHKLKTRVPYLLKLAPLLECRPLPPSSAWPTAFNNTCAQFLPPNAFWAEANSEVAQHELNMSDAAVTPNDPKGRSGSEMRQNETLRIAQVKGSHQNNCDGMDDT